MSGNTFGCIFRVTTFGESHGEAVGVVVDGCPSGLEIDEVEVQAELDRRRPGQSRITTPRKEEDRVRILSGVFEGRTTGMPIAMVVENKNTDPSVYGPLKDKPRPSHGDYTYQVKYGHRDWRGGGRSSGRETIGRVAAGAVAKKLLAALADIEILGHTIEVAGIRAREVTNDDIRREVSRNPVRCADPQAAMLMEKAILETRKDHDSVGGIVEVLSLNVPPGLGEPVFDKLDADLAKGLMSIGAVKGVEIGAGFGSARLNGSQANDEFILKEGRIETLTNNSGGILGGISNGMPLIMRAAIKPTASIEKVQRTVDISTKKPVEIEIKGRHDPCIVPRVLPVCEAMTALVLADHILRNRASKLKD